MGKIKKKYTRGNEYVFKIGHPKFRSTKRISSSESINLRSREVIFSDESIPPAPIPSFAQPSTSNIDQLEHDSVNKNKHRDMPYQERTSATWKRESQSYRCVHVERNAVMWNTVFKEHKTNFPLCEGFLHWDLAAEQSRGLGCRQKVICTNCHYNSKMFNLFEEVETGKRGRKPAQPNYGLAIGLSKSPIAATSFRRICSSANIKPPSHSGIQKASNRVLPQIVQINSDDMIQRRTKLIEKQRLAGVKNPKVFNLQADAVYNNNLYSGIGKTPFQPSTQVIYSVAEHITEDRDIIGLIVHNKLCSKRKHLDVRHICRAGKCFQTIPFEKNIGDERTWAYEALLQLKRESDVEVGHLITDPSSSASLAAEDLFDEKIVETRPIPMLDVAHVSRNHRKYMRRHKKLPSIIEGPTAEIRKKNLDNLALDIPERCQSEVKQISEKFNGDEEKIHNKLSYAIDAMVQCYQGSHSKCKKYSFVCKAKKKKNWLTNSVFLDEHFELTDTEATSDILRDCISYRLGPDMLKQTRADFNTQKVEAFNRALRTSLPKSVTFSRNVTGRAHSACHSINQGGGNSIRYLTNKLGCGISPNSKVDKALNQIQKYEKWNRLYKKSKKSMKKRRKRRKRVFALHKIHKEEVDQQPVLIRKPTLRKEQKEHPYTVNERTKRVKPRM